MPKKVEKEGLRRTAGEMAQQDGVGRAWRWNLGTEKWVTCRRVELRPPEGWISKTASDKPGDGISAPKSGSCAHTCQRVELGLPEKSDAWMTVFRRSFLRLVDRPRAPWNPRSPTGEELVGKSHRRREDLTAATGRSDGGGGGNRGFWKENKVTGRKHGHRKRN